MNAGRLRGATQTLAGAAVMITVVTIASRLVGFLRSMAQVKYVGTEGVGAAYAAANVLPNVLFEVAAGGALAGAVVPLLAGPLARRAGVETSRIASALLGWTLVALVPLALLVVVVAHPVASFLSDDPEIVRLVAAFLRVFALQVPLYGLAVVLGGILQAHKRFFWQAAAPLFSSLVVIAVFIGFGVLAQGDPRRPESVSAASLEWLAWGTTAGVAMLALPLVVPVWRTGVRLRPTLRFPGGEGRRAAHLAFAGIGALVAQQASVLAVMKSAFDAGPASTFAVYLQAQQVYLLPYAVLAFPLATSSFPRLAEHVAHARHAAYRRLLSTTTRALLTVTGAGTAALVAASVPVESAYADFATGSVLGMALALAWMAPGLIGFALILHLTRALYVIDRQRAAVVATASGWAVVAGAALVLPTALGATEQPAVLRLLGLATTLGMAVAATGLLVAVRRAAGGDAVAGVPRTLSVVTAGTALGAWAGASIAGVLLPDGASLLVALGVGIVAALVATVVVLASSFVADRAALGAILRRGRGTPSDVEAQSD
ncbi:murein biosynthesis integral membrane protein MurJ [Oerskovia flava]|uniref:murein biosynthesis integral membrane protein MurJ n=1 Tax=Oerskovia flava TaxID=2986422 RepID=UPI002240B062|nr:lipid II flippase MurJ [Oerskovia sp. JB1-3-2]